MKCLVLVLLVSILYYDSFAAVGPITGPNNVCVSSTITLNDTTSGGTWSSSNTAIATIGPTTGTVTGIASGIANITYTTIFSFSVITVTVNPVPTPIYFGYGDSSVCTGSGFYLHDDFSGGIWTSSSPSHATVDSANGYLSGISPGAATISYILATGCKTATPFNVYQTPSTIGVAPPTICQGDTIRFSCPIPTGGQWSTDDTAIATVVSGVVTTRSPGTFILEYIDSTNHCNVDIFLIVDANPAPINGPAYICEGSSIPLWDTTSGGIWSCNPPGIVTVDSISGVVTGIAIGLSTVSYTLNNGCHITYPANVTSAICSGTPSGGTAFANIPIPCVGVHEMISLSGATSGCNITYQWQNSPDGISFTNLPGATSTSYSYDVNSPEYFRRKTTCTNSGLYAYSTIVSVAPHTTIAIHTISSPADSICNNLIFYVSACGVSPSFNVTTWFGDGTSVNTPLTTSGVCYANIPHSYNLPGTYLIKQVLYIGAIPQDSVFFSYEYLYCRTLPFRFYFDANSNCLFDSGDKQNVLPIKTEIDSNGIAIDTISATSGFYYPAKGTPGTVYTFRIITSPGGLHITCPTIGVLYDTIQPLVNNYRVKYFGLSCNTGTSFDLVEHISTQTGRHAQTGVIIIDNPFCTPEDAIVTLHFSPRYNFNSAVPEPTTVSGTTATWNLSSISSDLNSSQTIRYALEVPSTWLLPGDTINSNYVTAGTTSGDIDTSNNVISKNDTVRASYDPNEISVSPRGNILPCTQLQYTVRFENNGNDTARNIHILDTLSNHLDPKSINVVSASSTMNIAVTNDGTHNIIKFDLPNINLPDSSHHNQCEGMIIFNIKAKAGISDGTTISNSAAVFFDDNPPVETNVVQNMVGVNPISGSSNVCIGSSIALSNSMPGGTWTSNNLAIATIDSSLGSVLGIAGGTTIVTYAITNSCTISHSVTTVTVKHLPAPYSVTGGGSYCAGGTGVHVGISNSETGVNYTLYNGALAIDSLIPGTGSHLDFGLQTMAGIYSVQGTNSLTSCTNHMPDSAVVTLTSPVHPSVSITSSVPDSSCRGTLVTLNASSINGGSSPLYRWKVNGLIIATGGTFNYFPSDSDIVTALLTSNAYCIDVDTATSSINMKVVVPLTPAVNISSFPATNISPSDTVILTAIATGVGTAPAYQWVLNRSYIAGATEATFTSNSFSNYDTIVCFITTSNDCGNVLASGSMVININTDGINKLKGDGVIVISPNPNKGNFVIRGSLSTGEREPVPVTITDVTGRKVYKNSFEETNGIINEHINLNSDLPNGVYLLTLQYGGVNKVFHFSLDR